jgi:hypothetical protein
MVFIGFLAFAIATRDAHHFSLAARNTHSTIRNGIALF